MKRCNEMLRCNEKLQVAKFPKDNVQNVTKSYNVTICYMGKRAKNGENVTERYKCMQSQV